MTFQKGDTVRLTTHHRGLDRNRVPRSYLPATLFEVVSVHDGWVKVRELEPVACVVLIPEGKLRLANGVLAGHDGDHVGGGPVG